MKAVVAALTGSALYLASLFLEDNRHLWLWEYTEWLLLAYWLVYAFVLERAARHVYEGLRDAPPPRRRVAIPTLAAYLMFALPVLVRAVYLLWNFLGHTGLAEGMGWIRLYWPVGMALNVVCAMALVGDVARGPFRVGIDGSRTVLLVVQHMPFVSLYASYLSLSIGQWEPLASWALVAHVVLLLVRRFA